MRDVGARVSLGRAPGCAPSGVRTLHRAGDLCACVALRKSGSRDFQMRLPFSRLHARRGGGQPGPHPTRISRLHHRERTLMTRSVPVWSPSRAGPRAALPSPGPWCRQGRPRLSGAPCGTAWTPQPLPPSRRLKVTSRMAEAGAGTRVAAEPEVLPGRTEHQWQEMPRPGGRVAGGPTFPLVQHLRG